MALVDVAYAGVEYYSASVIGSRGAAYADDHRNTNLVLGKHSGKAAYHARLEELGYHDISQEQIEEFGGRYFWPDIESVTSNGRILG